MRFAAGWSRTIIVGRRSSRGSRSGHFGVAAGTTGLRRERKEEEDEMKKKISWFEKKLKSVAEK